MAARLGHFTGTSRGQLDARRLTQLSDRAATGISMTFQLPV